MNMFKKGVALALAVIVSVAPLNAVYAAENEGQEDVSSVVFQNEADAEVMNDPIEEEVLDNEEDLAEPEITVTPEPTVTPEEMDISEETPASVVLEETPMPEVTIDLTRNAKSVIEGWNGVGNRWQYFKKDAGGNLVPASGWDNIDGKRFYFDPKDDNYVVSGFKTIAKKTYYFANKGDAGVFGAMATGWLTVNKKIFYFNEAGTGVSRGEMLTGWQTIAKKIYYFSKAKGVGNKGAVLTGWRKIGGKTYYFSKTKGQGKKGVLLQGWQKLSYKDKRTGTTKKGVFYLSKAKKIGKKGTMLTGWVKISGKWYYMNDKNGNKNINVGVRQSNRWMKISGSWYRFNKSGEALTGWQYIDGLKYYFNSKCKLSQDVRGRVKGPYRATINRKTNVVTIYARDGANGFIIPVKAFTCSVGRAEKPTPTGTFNTSVRYRWKELIGPSWGQYATRIVGGILFHSVSGPQPTIYSLPAAEYNKLGGPASSGCVRLSVRDAKWIYENCQLGMQVTISDTAYQPFDKPATIKIPSSQNWDPTDPAIR